MKTRYFVELEVDYDEEGLDEGHPDSDAVGAGDLGVYRASARVVNLENGTIGEGSCGGISGGDESEGHILEILRDCLDDAQRTAGVNK
jgi:hypothetical protein